MSELNDHDRIGLLMATHEAAAQIGKSSIAMRRGDKNAAAAHNQAALRLLNTISDELRFGAINIGSAECE